MKTFIITMGLLVLMAIVGVAISSVIGAGGFKRMVTLTGVYAVCKPQGYEAVCFLDADSRQGGLSCIAYSGECKK